MSARDRVIATVSMLSADASADEVCAAVKAAMLPTEPRYVGAVVRVSESCVFVRMDESETAWIRPGGNTGWNSWQTVCEYGAPVELVPITELDRAQRVYRDAEARFAALYRSVKTWRRARIQPHDVDAVDWAALDAILRKANQS